MWKKYSEDMDSKNTEMISYDSFTRHALKTSMRHYQCQSWTVNQYSSVQVLSTHCSAYFRCFSAPTHLAQTNGSLTDLYKRVCWSSETSTTCTAGESWEPGLKNTALVDRMKVIFSDEPRTCIGRGDGAGASVWCTSMKLVNYEEESKKISIVVDYRGVHVR